VLNPSEREAQGCRNAIYADYAHNFEGALSQFDEKAAERWGAAYEWYLRRWLPTARDARILDVGCGSGRFLHFLKRRGYTRLTGVDLSQSQVQLARQTGIPVFCEDAIRYLQCQPSAFELIIGLDIVEHFRKDEVIDFLRAIRGALVPGGYVILQTPNAESPFFGRLRYGDFTHEVCFTPGSLAFVASVANLETIEFRECAPVPWGYSLLSTGRAVAWAAIRRVLRVVVAVERGTMQDGPLTVNLLWRGRRSL
jgi:SAM-dependent methyltransferase